MSPLSGSWRRKVLQSSTSLDWAAMACHANAQHLDQILLHARWIATVHGAASGSFGDAEPSFVVEQKEHAGGQDQVAIFLVHHRLPGKEALILRKK